MSAVVMDGLRNPEVDWRLACIDATLECAAVPAPPNEAAGESEASGSAGVASGDASESTVSAGVSTTSSASAADSFALFPRQVR